jgi:hypothetical protein
MHQMTVMAAPSKQQIRERILRLLQDEEVTPSALLTQLKAEFPESLVKSALSDLLSEYSVELLSDRKLRVSG